MSLRQHLPTAALCSATVLLSVAGGATAAGLITGDEIKNGTIASTDIEDRTVAPSDLGRDAVAGRKVRDGSVTGTDVRDDSLTGADVDEGTLEIGGDAPGAAGTTVYTWTAPFSYDSGRWGEFSEMSLPADSTLTAHQFDVAADGCSSFLLGFTSGPVVAEAGSGGIQELGAADTGQGVDHLSFDVRRDAGTGPCTGTFSFEFSVATNPDGPVETFD